MILAGVSIATLTGDNGLLRKAQQAKEATAEAEAKDLAQLKDLENYMNGITVSEEGYSEEEKVNKPNLKLGMIPVYYDEDNKVWKKADETNKGEHKWYDYDAKQWANIVTVSDENKQLRNAEVDTEIPMYAITTFFVWIPRYAYSITSNYQVGSTSDADTVSTIDVTFLKGNTNTGVDGVTYETDYDETKVNVGEATPKIVHPGFTLGNSQITGIWGAKFEASGLNGTQAVGNASSGSSAPVEPAEDGSTYVRILPSQISWRHITIGESEYQSMKMSTNTEKYGWTIAVNSHLMKNSEWGAVAYLCYSKYGSVPKINGAGIDASKDGSTWYYDMYTGAGPVSAASEGRYETFTEETNGYNTDLGKLASTTGTVYGVYDMSGGAWERVAAYLDNGNGNLNSQGQSSTRVDGETIKYIENGNVKNEYRSLWEVYQVSEEEKSGKIQVEGVGEQTQRQLWNWANKTEAYNEARKRLTEANYKNMAKYKGIGVNEVGSEFSYYAPQGTTNGSYGWYMTVKNTETDTTQEYGRAWSRDYTLIGHASSPFVVRGGYCNGGSRAGVLCSNITGGHAFSYYGFRPVLAF